MKKLVLVGFGDSYQSIVHLYGKRNSQEVKELVKGTVAFLNKTQLKPVVPVMDESMVEWYYKNSLIFTGCSNSCWNGTNGSGGSSSSGGSSGSNGKSDSGEEYSNKRPRKKFGRVIKSKSDGLPDVIQDKFDEGVDFILDSIEDFSASEDS